MRKLLGLLFFVCLTSHAICQNNLPPVYEIKTDTAYMTIPDSCWQMLEDANEKWTIDQVSQAPLSEKFHLNTGTKSSVNTYWVRYKLKNNMTREAKITFGNGPTSHFDIFVKQDSAWKHKKTGYFIPWSKRDGLKDIRRIPFIIEPGQELLVYQRMKFELWLYPNKDIVISLGVAKNLMSDTYNSETLYPEGLQFGFVFGICVLAAIFCFFFFLATHEWVYFHASMMNLFLALLNFMDPLQIVFLREFPGVRDFGLPVVIAFFLYFMNSTFLIAVDAKHLFPRLNKFLFGLSILPFLLLFVEYVFRNPDIKLYIFFPAIAALMFLSIFVGCLVVMRKKFKVAKFLIIGVLFFSFYDCTGLTTEVTGIRVPAWLTGPYIEILLTFWLIIATLATLFDRYRQLQKKVLQEAFEKEQIAKEKEIERRQLIEQQKIELEKQVTERTAELKQSLENLKSTQSQLIQSEKMASLGELTAGIAHEIQNPLNFVNNFSEVNGELISELVDEVDKGNTTEAKSIAEDIKQNLEKINHHGKRADAIVKGMLQHSRTSSGQKELTDINALCDEYLRLAYHGLRAKDKSFNAEFKTDFDSSIGKINIVPQDIGRVLLNLINNAFYAVNEKQKQSLNGYEPFVIVATTRQNGKIKISIQDNGDGIPLSIKEKIFQPFFTTKPTGQGTGLGLSLAYDIIKAHGGEMKVETKEGEGSEFTIQLLFS